MAFRALRLERKAQSLVDPSELAGAHSEEGTSTDIHPIVEVCGMIEIDNFEDKRRHGCLALGKQHQQAKIQAESP
jgi:hypothetical protein